MIVPSITKAWLREHFSEHLADCDPDARVGTMILHIRKRVLGDRGNWVHRTMTRWLETLMLHNYWDSISETAQEKCRNPKLYAWSPQIHGVRAMLFHQKGRWWAFSRKLDPDTLFPYELPLRLPKQGPPGRTLLDVMIYPATAGALKAAVADSHGLGGDTPAHLVWELLAHPEALQIQDQNPGCLRVGLQDALFIGTQDVTKFKWLARQCMIESIQDALGDPFDPPFYSLGPEPKTMIAEGLWYHRIDAPYDFQWRRTNARIKRRGADEPSAETRERYFDMLPAPTSSFLDQPPSWRGPVNK